MSADDDVLAIFIMAYEGSLAVLNVGTHLLISFLSERQLRKAVDNLHDIRIRMVTFIYQQRVVVTQIVVVNLQFINY